MKISKKTYSVVGSRKEINFKEDDEEWSEAFILYNSYNIDDELNMRHRFSYFSVRDWVIAEVKKETIKIK